VKAVRLKMMSERYALTVVECSHSHIKQHRAPSTVAGQNAINLQPSLKQTWLFTHCKTVSNC